MGSSTAAGYGAQSRPWAAVLGDTYLSYSVSIVNIAQPGTTTYHGLPLNAVADASRPRPLVSSNVDAALSYYPKALIVSYPTNDTVAGYSVSETVGNVLTIRQTAYAQNVAVVVVSTQPRDLTVAQLAQLQQIDDQIGQAAEPCFVAVRAALAGPDGRLAPGYDSGDGVHLNDAGHAVIAEKIVTLIASGRCVSVSGR